MLEADEAAAAAVSDGDEVEEVDGVGEELVMTMVELCTRGGAVAPSTPVAAALLNAKGPVPVAVPTVTPASVIPLSTWRPLCNGEMCMRNRGERRQVVDGSCEVKNDEGCARWKPSDD